LDDLVLNVFCVSGIQCVVITVCGTFRWINFVLCSSLYMCLVIKNILCEFLCTIDHCKCSTEIAEFVILMAVTMKITVFWDVMTGSLVESCRHFGITCCLNLQGRTSPPEDGGSTCHTPDDTNLLFLRLTTGRFLESITHGGKPPRQSGRLKLCHFLQNSPLHCCLTCMYFNFYLD